MNKTKKNKAITLIALVITIVVLIILAAIAINLSLGNNGIFNRAKTGKELYQNAESYEESRLLSVTNDVDNMVGGSRETITISKDEWDKVEKVETIPMTEVLGLGNNTLNYDFSKYKRLRCYAEICNDLPMIFEIDLSTFNSSNTNAGTLNRYAGGGAISRYLNDLQHVFVCDMYVNGEKNCLTLAKLGFISGTTYNDRIPATYALYYVYKVEGIY